MNLSGKHAQALDHSKTAVISILSKIPDMLRINHRITDFNWLEHNRLHEDVKPFLDMVSLLVIAHHNMAVEQEHLGLVHESLATYYDGLSWAEKFLNKKIPENTPTDEQVNYQHALYLKLRKGLDVSNNTMKY
jgi:hypothetical protein